MQARAAEHLGGLAERIALDGAHGVAVVQVLVVLAATHPEWNLELAQQGVTLRRARRQHEPAGRAGAAPAGTARPAGAGPSDELGLIEEEGDLAGGALGAVGAVHHVLFLGQREVAADGARSRLRPSR